MWSTDILPPCSSSSTLFPTLTLLYLSNLRLFRVFTTWQTCHMSHSHVTSSFLPGPECLLSPSVTHDSSADYWEQETSHNICTGGAGNSWTLQHQPGHFPVLGAGRELLCVTSHLLRCSDHSDAGEVTLGYTLPGPLPHFLLSDQKWSWSNNKLKALFQTSLTCLKTLPLQI